MNDNRIGQQHNDEKDDNDGEKYKSQKFETEKTEEKKLMKKTYCVGENRD